MSDSAETAKTEAAGQAGTTSASDADAAIPPTPASCRKKKSDVNEGFIKDIVNHIDEFVNASYDEHKTCLQKSVRKVIAISLKHICA
jgi:hypothetical protein